MNCSRCGGLMCPETVIRLQRTMFGVRESCRLQGAYCASCKTGIVMARVGASVPPDIRVADRLRRLWYRWGHMAPASRTPWQRQHDPVGLITRRADAAG